MSERCYYEILGVTAVATQKEIDVAYRRLAVKYHPDHNPNNKEAIEKFKEATAARELLSAPDLRRAYDELKHRGAATRSARPDNSNDGATSRRHRWTGEGWCKSKKGNWYRNVGGYNVGVYPCNRHVGRWRWWIRNEEGYSDYSRGNFPDIEIAKLDLLNAIDKLVELAH